MKKTLVATVIALAAAPGAAETVKERPYALELTAATFGGGFDGLGVRDDSGSMAIVEVAGRPELRGERWELKVPFRFAHRQTFGADLSETSGALDLEPWYQATDRVRLGLEGGVLGASRPDWPDLYQRDPVTGALRPTDRYGYFAWRAGAQLYARPAAHQHLRARYRYASYDYVADPAFDEILDVMHLTPRDRTEHQLDASWRYVEKRWAAGLRVDYTFRDYTTLLARDRRTGSAPATNPSQEFAIWEPSAEVELEPGNGRVALSLRYGLRLQDDPYQGYYSYTGHHPRVQVKLAATPRLDLRASLEGLYVEYGADGSTRLEGADTRRTDSRTKIGADVAYRLGRALSLQGRVAWVERSTNYRDYVPTSAGGTSSYDIDFDYTNLVALAGLQYEL